MYIKIADIEKALDGQITFALSLVKRYATDKRQDTFTALQDLCKDQLSGMQILLQDTLPWDDYKKAAEKIKAAKGKIERTFWKGGAA